MSNNLNKNTNTNAILFEFVNGTLVSSEFQLIDLQRNQIKLVSETGDEYIIHSDYSIPDFCFDGGFGNIYGFEKRVVVSDCVSRENRERHYLQFSDRREAES